MPHDDPLLAQATEWAVRVGDPAFADWEAFASWLSQDRTHAEAYDRVAAAVAAAAEVEKAEPAPANDEPALPVRHTRRWLGGAIAASLAAVLAIGLWQMRDDRYAVETPPGEMRTVALDGGGKIELSGGTHLTLDHDDPRFASLDSGQALFTVRHDAAHPFSVKLGDDTVVDVGTVFDVRRDKSGLSVAVSEGSVAFNPDSQNVRLRPGEMLAHKAGEDGIVVSKVSVDQVGEWRAGRITFRQATLGEIADRLSRATGVPYSAAAGSASYSGSVLVTPLRDEPQSLAPLLGVKVVRAGKEWVIEAP